jgi:hypothetical protein
MTNRPTELPQHFIQSFGARTLGKELLDCFRLVEDTLLELESIL